MDTLLSLEDILGATGGIHLLGSGGNICFTDVQTDSRKVGRNTLFVPLIGEKQDGHAYIPQALEKGSSVIFMALANYEKDSDFFVQQSLAHQECCFIGVENTLHALQALAMRYVAQFPRLIKIGVTGSSGKTTTKELLRSILSQKYSVVANEGNLNSETGLPLSVFKIRAEHQVGLFEMGMNRKDEMGELAAVLKPRFAVITNIGTAHIGMLGGRRQIAEEKAKIFSHFNGFGTAVIPKDDDFSDFLAQQVDGKVVFYGDGQPESVRLIADEGLLGTVFSLEGLTVRLSLPGRYNYRNALAAITLAQVLGLSASEIKRGVEECQPLFGRGEVIRGTYTVIQDCYNANPDSMEKAVSMVASLSGGQRRFLVLGDMLELGENSRRDHARIGSLAADSGVDALVFVGTEMRSAFEAAQAKLASQTQTKLFYFAGSGEDVMRQAADAVLSLAQPEDIVLVKGSRGMALERVTKLLLGERTNV